MDIFQAVCQTLAFNASFLPVVGSDSPSLDSVKQALKNYFAQLNGQDVNDLYELVLAEVEQPLLDMVMQYTRGNQTRAALMMGINRGTLRKKLKKYGMN
ncbi:DNA-binding transcriptional regulator Fis [Salmonella enterica]|uniref:DNA-binding transcriptional regulator Fis n=1 Tax=Salmonella enterica TaxID=28901 RepID=UPI003529FA11